MKGKPPYQSCLIQSKFYSENSMVDKQPRNLSNNQNYTCFFSISNQVAKGLTLKMVQKLGNLLSNLQR